MGIKVELIDSVHQQSFSCMLEWNVYFSIRLYTPATAHNYFISANDHFFSSVIKPLNLFILVTFCLKKGQP